MKLTFGKFKGKDLEEVDFSYLQWLEEQDWIKDDLRKAILFEFNRRANPTIGKVIKQHEPK